MTTSDQARRGDLPLDADLQAMPEDPQPLVEGELPSGFGEGWAGRIAFGMAIAFSAFQIYVSAYAFLPSQVVRAMHVGFLLLLGFVLIANLRTPSTAGKVLLWGLGIAGMATGIYQWVFYEDLLLRVGGFLEPQDIAVGVVLIALVFEATRRLMGAALAIISGVFFAYCLFGNYLPPAFLGHRGYDFDQVVDAIAFGTEGIYGVPIYVSSTYIFLFILFGSFLERAGMIKLFNDVALGFVGQARGGPAKVAVLSSGLMGMISGSGVANVVASGQFTIPLMRRFGYSRAFAGGVEATSSMGGQIMPPVMGAVAFIMAETLNVPYVEVVKAAIIPALLYFGACFLMVHLEAGKRHLLGLPAEECPNPWIALRDQWYLVIPLAVLVYLLFAGYTPLFAGTMGLALTTVLILGSGIAGGLPNIAVRSIFWIALGFACAAFFEYGVDVVAIVLGLLILVNAVFRGGRETLLACRDALAEGARNALPVGIACAMVGVIIGTLTLTGAATTFVGYIVRIGETSLFLSLLLTMITCLILGMGIPTIPNYIITSSIAGPALLDLGVPLIVSHMFVFYFGIMADLTPPVALAAFAAAPIAKESGLKIGIQAVKIAIAGFVVPFMAVYTPALMLQDGGPMAEAVGYWPAVLYIVFKAILSMCLWGAAAIGFMFVPLLWWERVLCTVAAFMIVVPSPVTDVIGLALCGVAIAIHVWRMRRAAGEAPPEGALAPGMAARQQDT